METNNKLREALEESRRIASDLGGCRLNDYWKLNEIVRVCEAALAEPVKNCEVGTAEEQAARMNEFCNSHGHGFDGHGIYACENCKLISIDRCELAWAQMPYVEKEGGAK